MQAALVAAFLALCLSGAGAMRPSPGFFEASLAAVEPARRTPRGELQHSANASSLAQKHDHATNSTAGLAKAAKKPRGLSSGSMTLLWVFVSSIYLAVLALTVLAFFCFMRRRGEHDMELTKNATSLLGEPPVDLNSEDTTFAESLRLSWLSMRFKDQRVDAQWHEQGKEAQQLSHCARVLFFVSCSMAAYEVLQIVLLHFRHDLERKWHFHFVLLLVQGGLMAAEISCYRRPSEILFWPPLFAMYFLIPATSLPPLTDSCVKMAALAEHSHEQLQTWGESFTCLDEAVRHVDCSPQGHTAMQMIMTWLLLQPWVLPHLEHLHMVWFWVLLVYPGWIAATMHITGDKVFDHQDCVFRVGLLSLTLLVALVKKFSLEKSRRVKFLQELQQKASSAKIFHILEYMMPMHVIGPMLTDPGTPIADQVNRVSILFVLINDFDQFTRRKTPSELLRFLNEQFMQFDDICAANKVTKIETVGEEYVAAVGVLPKDKEENERLGHGVLLERLLVAASQIMQLQTDEVKFKMGVHSGSIVAGVIGTKLPRYRLFGDTINSAARMMQKGIPGQLQFGEETHRSVPEHIMQQVSYRGEVEMKGKGKVKAWTFQAASEDVSSLPQVSQRGRTKTDGGAMASKRKHRSTVTAAVALTGDANALIPQDDSLFEEALQQMTTAETVKSSSRWFLSEKEGFTPELDRMWFAWFHQSVICHKIVRRFGMEAILVLALSGTELWYMMDIKMSMGEAAKAWHPFYRPELRLAIFVYTRGFVVLTAMLFWYYAEASNWIQNNPSKSQTLILAASCVAMMCIYVSYDALVFSNSRQFRQRTDFAHNFRAPDDEVYTLNFVLFVFLYMRQHALLFYPSLVLLPISILVIMAPNFYNFFVHAFSELTHENYKESIFSVQGELLFIIQAMITIIVAHEDEQSSRARFKMRHTVQETQKRTEGILDTLMPPLVVKALRDLAPSEPMPTDQYRHAMIAQSDLCGFTQLSANRKPTEVVKFMGDLFGAFDLLTDKHGVYKVETVGDAYIAGMAEQPLTKTNSPYRVLLFGLDMVRAVDAWATAMGVNVACRVGIAYGECIGGIVGTDMQRYHLFGDLLTIMDVLEATSIEGRVQISAPCKQEVERQLREEAGEVWPEVLTFCKREDLHLKTSKGEVHEYSEVGGPTFLVESSEPLRNTRA